MALSSSTGQKLTMALGGAASYSHQDVPHLPSSLHSPSLHCVHSLLLLFLFHPSATRLLILVAPGASGCLGLSQKQVSVIVTDVPRVCSAHLDHLQNSTWGCCGGLNDNGSHRFVYLISCCPGDGTVWEGLANVPLWEDLWADFEVSRTHVIPN